jgi:hypothetical protein
MILLDLNEGLVCTLYLKISKLYLIVYQLKELKIDSLKNFNP